MDHCPISCSSFPNPIKRSEKEFVGCNRRGVWESTIQRTRQINYGVDMGSELKDSKIHLNIIAFFGVGAAFFPTKLDKEEFEFITAHPVTRLIYLTS
ncbi:hypothetical protein ACTXT7_010828 [Hymenolepis weldensis]